MNKRKTIYLADDDFDDRMLLRDAFNLIDAEIEIIEAQDGVELFDNLKDISKFTECIILLDINMPRMNGLEALGKLKETPGLSEIPAVMVSTSGNPEVIRMTEALGAAAYFTKPSSLAGLHDIARKIIQEITWAQI